MPKRLWGAEMNDEIEMHDINMEKFMWIVLIAVILIVNGIAMSHKFDPKPEAKRIEQIHDPKPYDIKKVDK